jgi:hypothetical protein
MDRHESPPKPSTVEPINGVSHPSASSPTNRPQRQSVSLRESPLSPVYNDQNNIGKSAIYPDFQQPQVTQGGSSVPGEVSLLPSARNSQSLEQIHLGSDDITLLFHKYVVTMIYNMSNADRSQLL